MIDVAHDRDHGRTGPASVTAFFAAPAAASISFAVCSSKVITFVSAPKKRAISLASSASSVWLIGGENTASQQARDQILGANFELLRQILDADSFGDGDAARDRHAARSTPPCAAAAYSPSSGLLLRRAEHSAGPAGAPDAPGRLPGRVGPGGGSAGPTPRDALRRATAAWDAWDGARRGAAADAAPAGGALRDAGAGKSAGRAPDVRERDATHRRRHPRLHWRRSRTHGSFVHRPRPVCGTIMRGAGAAGGGGAAGRAAMRSRWRSACRNRTVAAPLPEQKSAPAVAAPGVRAARSQATM